MSITKDGWNRNHYTQVKVSVRPDVATGFKALCEHDGTSMAAKIGGYMAEQVGLPISKPGDSLPPVQTRRQRKEVMKNSIADIVRVLKAEERYRDNIPDNLKGSSVYEAADNIIEMLHEALNILEELYA